MVATKGVTMSRTQLRDHNILLSFTSGQLSRVAAAQCLGVHCRTISRRAKRLNEQGIIGLIHGNSGKIPINKTSAELKTRVLDLVRKKYFDFNVTHCLEKLKANEGIELTYAVLYSWCRQANLIKRNKRRRANPRKLRERLPMEGLMLQLDGSHHKWNGKDTWVLIGLIDDATSKIPWAEFFMTEDTLNCMTVLQKVIEKYGIPQVIYTDKAGWLGGTTKREGFSQFLNACEGLGIRVIFANSPQAKGRIERAWNTFQDRLIPELRIEGITSIREANKYLHEQMLPNYWNTQNVVAPQVEEKGYKALPADVELNEILCLKETRKVNGNHTISWDNEIFAVEPPGGVSLAGRTIEIRSYQNMSFKAFFAGREVPLKSIVLPKKVKPLRVYGIPGITPKKVKSLFRENPTPTKDKVPNPQAQGSTPNSPHNNQAPPQFKNVS